jgi:Protein of unknown function (DUF3365)
VDCLSTRVSVLLPQNLPLPKFVARLTRLIPSLLVSLAKIASQFVKNGVDNMLKLILAALATTALSTALTLPALADEAPWVGEARKIASAMPPKLLGVLQEEIHKGGPESAINVCREKAPQMAKAASEQSGWNIRRVSLKNRNPKATPDTWEKAVLDEFERRVVAGENPISLEKSELVADGEQKIQRYMKALPTQDLCLACHGSAEAIPPAVSEQLRKLYPNDKATGYAAAEIRGAITLKKFVQ